jgi:hypothetical protein
MDVEQLRALFELVPQFVGRHQHTGALLAAPRRRWRPEGNSA